ncbi:nitroreductase family protein [Paenibacillus sp. SI8]|uniref:nitroreductase family protein n=1 Tax=unclassified Paenibacillus TaxID=185978 RepID=UPI00346673CE
MSTLQREIKAIIEELSPEVRENRQAEYGVNPLFLNRWSPRSYTNQQVSDEVLYAVLEAARWAPSSSNGQPWKFIIAKTEEQLNLFQTFIKPNNRLWTDHAPVLILILSAKYREDGAVNGASAFDAGAAWASLALQAKLLGLATRAVGGYDQEQARIALHIPEAYNLHAVIALGYQGEKELLEESFQEKEKPNGRRSLHESIIEGSFPAQAIN